MHEGITGGDGENHSLEEWFKKLIAGCFGLLHGFGFANVLGELPIPEAYIVPSLFGFNVGVELGQLVVVAAVFPFLYLMRNTSFYAKLVMPVATTYSALHRQQRLLQLKIGWKQLA